MDSNQQYPEEKLPAIDRRLAVASAGERGTWRSEPGKDGPKCRMPTTTNGLGPRLRDSQDRKKAATARPVRISRVLAVVLFPSGWQFRFDQVRKLFIGF